MSTSILNFNFLIIVKKLQMVKIMQVTNIASQKFIEKGRKYINKF